MWVDAGSEPVFTSPINAPMIVEKPLCAADAFSLSVPEVHRNVLTRIALQAIQEMYLDCVVTLFHSMS